MRAKHRRTWLLVGVLGLLAAVFAVNEVHTRLLARGLRPIAEQKAAECAAAEGVGSTGRVTHEVSVAKPYWVAGRPSGKVSVYIGGDAAGGEQGYVSYEYFFVLEGGQWVLTESGRCTDTQCRRRAERAFAR